MGRLNDKVALVSGGGSIINISSIDGMVGSPPTPRPIRRSFAA